jgi:hypothetical protein
MAFGVRSALVYTGLAVILAPWPLLFVVPDPVRLDVKLALLLIPWPGLFIVPHMVRLDIKLLLDVEPDESPREDRGAEGGTGAPEEIMGFSDERDASHPATPSATPESSAGAEDVWKEIARDDDRGSKRSP